MVQSSLNEPLHTIFNTRCSCYGNHDAGVLPVFKQEGSPSDGT